MSSPSGLMSNVCGPREARKRLLVSIVQSILLYGALTWASLLVYNSWVVETLARVYRQAAIRSTCAYRKVSYDAVHVVTRTPLINLLAVERASAYTVAYL